MPSHNEELATAGFDTVGGSAPETRQTATDLQHPSVSIPAPTPVVESGSAMATPSTPELLAAADENFGGSATSTESIANSIYTATLVGDNGAGNTGPASVYYQNGNGEGDSEGVKKAPVRLDPGEKRPTDQFQINIFDRPLTIGGQYQIQPQYLKDHKLDPDERDDVGRLDQTLKIELLYRLAEATTVFIQGTLFHQADVYSEADNTKETGGFERTQSWIFFQNILDSKYSLQVGRQRFSDKRQWWWNEQLDGVRLYYNNETVAAELAVAEDVAVKASDEDFIDPEQDGVFRILGDAIWEWQEKQVLGAFVLSQIDHSPTESVGASIGPRRDDLWDADLTWLGTRAYGKFRANDALKLTYWLDSAVVFGRENALDLEKLEDKSFRVLARHQNDVFGWAVDTGMTLYTDWPYEPYFTLGYARGSGDSSPNDGFNSSYRQSGVQGNKVKLGGHQRFRYYGEAFRPELSNMTIWTAGVGIPLSEDSAIDFLFHDYSQAQASTLIRDSRLDANPNGINTHLGQEFDLIVSLDEWKYSQFQLVCALFKAGDAFGDLSGNTMATLLFKFNYAF